MDNLNTTKWNITNSAQNIVSALIDPSKQFDHVFRREWSNTFSSFSQHRSSARDRQDTELKAKLNDYISKLQDRKHIKLYEAQRESKAQEQENASKELQNKIIIPEVFMMEDFDLSNLDTFTRVLALSDMSKKYLNSNNNDVSNQRFYSSSLYSSPLNPAPLLTKTQLKSLQQNFTDYLDIIEEKLANQVSNRSGDFFQVMSSVDSVMDELSLAIKSVTGLREKFSRLKEVLLLPNMKTMRLFQARNNAQLLLDKMKEKKVSLMQIQVEKFVNRFHDERMKSIEHILDIEQWGMVEDVPQEFQQLISLLLDENISIIETFSIDLNQFQYTLNSHHSGSEHKRGSSDIAASCIEDGVTEAKSSPTNGNSRQQVMAGKLAASLARLNNQSQRLNGGKTSYVTVNGTRYVIINSVIILIKCLMEYCKCAYDIRTLSSELLERLFIILQLYNTKTYHLVYSAGAIQVAGLKTITTRSLVISQQSLKLISLLIPVIQQHFSQLLPAYSRLRRFDELRVSYDDHASKIPARVNLIAREMMDAQLKEWEAKPPVPSPQFTSIVQHLMRLHDNIHDALPSEELKVLFYGIGLTFKEVLLGHLRRLNIANEDGLQRQWLVTQELALCKISLAKLSVFNDGLELNFDDLWSELNSDGSSKDSTSKETQ